MDDFELLKEYATRNSERAFSILVERYLNLVYSAARRQVHDPHIAEEVAQVVFLILARKAASIRAGTIVSGWLFRTTRFAAVNALRREQRRKHYEREAMATTSISSESDAAWNWIAPLLDDALTHLPDRDRDAIVLRFFENRSFREIGKCFGVSEDAAQKRVTRSLEKLRGFFARRGGRVIPVVLIASALGAHGVQAAPQGLVSMITTAALAKIPVGVTPVAQLLDATLRTFHRVRLQSLFLRLAPACLLISLAPIPWLKSSGTTPAPRHAAAISQPAAAPTALPGTPMDLQTPNQIAEASRFVFRVIDAVTSGPVSGAKLTLNETTVFPNRSTNYFQTDVQGFAILPLPAAEVTNWNYCIEVFRDGFVPKYVSWGASQGDAIDEFPKDYTTRLDPGTRIGGVVMTESKEPIGGARVTFSQSGPSSGASRQRERLTMMGNYHFELADSEGRWMCNHVPSNFEVVSWRLSHPEYQDISYVSDGPESPASIGPTKLPREDFLAGRAAMVMKRGLVIAGAILTDAGEPIARARVTIDHYFEKPESNTHTDANGQFRFANARAKETTLTVQADGFAPEDRAVQVAADLTEQRFSLSRGVLLRARVVDEAGQGVPGAIVRVSPDSLNRPIFDWMANTDVGGHFEWAHAPRSPQKYSVCADGFESQSKFPLSSDADEQVITLKKSSPRQRLRVVANVVDAETKRPVDSFDVLVSETRDEPFRTSLGNFRPNGTGTSGRGTFAVSSFAPRFAAEVRSDGYWPARATNVNSGQGELTLNFELRRALPIRGVVQLSDGAPVAGALVILCTGRDAAEMTSAAKLQLPRSGNATHTQTDADGRFTLPKRLEMRAIVVAHELGFAEVAPPQLENSEKIELLPWGRIEGVFHIGSELGANETMQLQNLAWRPGNQAVVFHREAKTDSAGHFVLEGVPPGEHRVQYRPKIRSSTIPASHGLPIVVRAGETSYVQVGGTGRMVIGRVVTDGIVEPIDWLREVHTLSLKVATPVEAAWPSKEEFSSDADFDRAVETYFERTRGFWLSDAGKALDRARRHYVLIFGEDGSFRINDVPPGIYQLSISPTKRRNANSPSVSQSPFGEPLASVSVEVTVPESEKEPVNEVIDVGTLVLKPAGR